MVGPTDNQCVFVGQTDFDNDCIQGGRSFRLYCLEGGSTDNTG